MTLAEALLEQGAVLGDGLAADLPADAPVDTAALRRYAHPALGDRPVVRLAGATVAPGDDQALAFLGFDEPEVSAPVGVVRRRGLGFPAWVLVNDPANAAAVLRTVREFERAARVARTRPGAARDLFDGLAARLPDHRHLPCFWEEAGRAYLAGGNQSYAASAFERAREAERTYALDVDEAARRDVFLEFAFAGALTAKSLAAYQKELANRYAPPEALDAFVQLALRRTLGGLPPWTDMPKQLRSLAKAAGADVRAVEDSVVAELLTVPATGQAAFGFWKALRPTLLRLATADPVARGQLLNLHPSPSRGDSDMTGWWLDLLDDCGALAAFDDPAAVAAEAAALPSPAGWIDRHLASGTRGWRVSAVVPQTLRLIERAAPVLRAEGRPITLPGSWRGLDANCADTAVAAGIAVELPADIRTVDLTNWLDGDATARRDLASLAADPTWRRRLLRSVPVHCERGGRTVDGLLAHDTLRPIVAEWLDGTVDKIAAGTLVEASEGLARLHETTGPRTFSELPAQRDRLGFDVAAALARTLRGGLGDEWGWPALDAVLDSLDLDGVPVTLSTSWPVLTLCTPTVAVAVGPAGEIARHDLRCGPVETVTATWVGSQFLVRWRPKNQYSAKAYWSADPADAFEPGGYWMWFDDVFSVLLPDGSRLDTDGALHEGDRRGPSEPGTVVGDGTHWWTTEWHDGAMRLVELDPATYATGRRSRPAFFEPEPPGWSLAVDLCSLLPAPDPAPTGPTAFGHADGVVGFRVLARDDGACRRVESVDGREIELDAGGPPGATAVLGWPGDAHLRVLTGGLARHGGTGMWLPPALLGRLVVGRGGASAPPMRGSGVVPPVPFLAMAEVRDGDGSAALRAVDDDGARQLLEAARADLADDPPPDLDAMEATRAAIDDVLPALSNPRLRRGVLGVLREAAQVAGRRDRLASRAESASSSGPVADGDDSLLGQATVGLLLRGGTGRGSTLHQVRSVSDWLAGTTPAGVAGDAEHLGTSTVPWPLAAAHPGALAWRAAGPATADSERAALATFLDVLADTVFVTTRDEVRVARLGQHRGEPLTVAGTDGDVRWAAVDTGLWADDQTSTWFERNPTGRAVRIDTTEPQPSADDLAHDDPAPLPGTVATAEWIGRFTALVRERGPVGWTADDATALASAAGTTPAVAALLLCGFPAKPWDRAPFAPAVRKAFGLSAADAARAADQLRPMTMIDRCRLLAAALPDDPVWFWDPPDGDGDRAAPGAPLARLAEAWVAAHGRHEPVPADAVATLPADGHASHGVIELVEAFMDVARVPALTVDHDVRPSVESEHRFGLARTDPPALTTPQVTQLATLLPWVHATRPVGDPLWRGLPAVLEAVRARLAHPGLMLDGPHLPSGSDHLEGAERILSALGGTPVDGLPEGMSGVDNGLLVAAAQYWMVSTWWRPARLTDDSQSDTLRSLDAAGHGGVPAVDLLRSPGYTALAERVGSTPVPDGGFEANPSLSVPDVVAAAADALGVGEESAVLFLQLLTLVDPTDRNVRRWNGWTAARHKKALAPLVDAGVVLGATRSRAGRSVFVEGGWTPVRPPHLPLEQWKLSLYGLTTDGYGKAVGPLQRFLPLRPLHELFGETWRRWSDGDRPGGAT